MRTQSYFEVHFCFTEPGGNVVQAFEIHFVWKFPECRPGVLDGELMLLRSEAAGYDESWEPVGFVVRFSKFGARLWLGPARNRNRYRVVAAGSGGNWHWETVRFAWQDAPHVFNWLRRQKNFSKAEWGEEFMTVWESRRVLDIRSLRRFSRLEVWRYLKAEARRCGFGDGVGSVQALVEASGPKTLLVEFPYEAQ